MAINNSRKTSKNKANIKAREMRVGETGKSGGNRMNHKLRVYNFFSLHFLSLLGHVQHINSHNGFWRRIQLDGDEKCKMDFKNPRIHT